MKKLLKGILDKIEISHCKIVEFNKIMHLKYFVIFNLINIYSF